MTTYEPYQEETYNIYLNEPLRKIGEYSDYIDFKNGKVVRKVGSYTFLGSEDFDNQTGGANTDTKIFFSINFSVDFLNGLLGKRKVLSNYFLESESNLQSNSTDVTGIHFNQNPTYSRFIYFKLPKTILETEDKAGMQKWVKNLYTNRQPLLINYQINEKETNNLEIPKIEPEKDIPVVNEENTIQNTEDQVKEDLMIGLDSILSSNDEIVMPKLTNIETDKIEMPKVEEKRVKVIFSKDVPDVAVKEILSSVF